MSRKKHQRAKGMLKPRRITPVQRSVLAFATNAVLLTSLNAGCKPVQTVQSTQYEFFAQSTQQNPIYNQPSKQKHPESSNPPVPGPVGMIDSPQNHPDLEARIDPVRINDVQRHSTPKRRSQYRNTAKSLRSDYDAQKQIARKDNRTICDLEKFRNKDEFESVLKYMPRSLRKKNFTRMVMFDDGTAYLWKDWDVKARVELNDRQQKRIGSVIGSLPIYQKAGYEGLLLSQIQALEEAKIPLELWPRALPQCTDGKPETIDEVLDYISRVNEAKSFEREVGAFKISDDVDEQISIINKAKNNPRRALFYFDRLHDKCSPTQELWLQSLNPRVQDLILDNVVSQGLQDDDRKERFYSRGSFDSVYFFAKSPELQLKLLELAAPDFQDKTHGYELLSKYELLSGAAKDERVQLKLIDLAVSYAHKRDTGYRADLLRSIFNSAKTQPVQKKSLAELLKIKGNFGTEAVEMIIASRKSPQLQDIIYNNSMFNISESELEDLVYYTRHNPSLAKRLIDDHADKNQKGLLRLAIEQGAARQKLAETVDIRAYSTIHGPEKALAAAMRLTQDDSPLQRIILERYVKGNACLTAKEITKSLPFISAESQKFLLKHTDSKFLPDVYFNAACETKAGALGLVHKGYACLERAMQRAKTADVQKMLLEHASIPVFTACGYNDPYSDEVCKTVEPMVAAAKHISIVKEIIKRTIVVNSPTSRANASLGLPDIYSNKDFMDLTRGLSHLKRYFIACETSGCLAWDGLKRTPENIKKMAEELTELHSGGDDNANRRYGDWLDENSMVNPGWDPEDMLAVYSNPDFETLTKGQDSIDQWDTARGAYRLIREEWKKELTPQNISKAVNEVIKHRNKKDNVAVWDENTTVIIATHTDMKNKYFVEYFRSKGCHVQNKYTKLQGPQDKELILDAAASSKYTPGRKVLLVYSTHGKPNHLHLAHGEVNTPDLNDMSSPLAISYIELGKRLKERAEREGTLEDMTLLISACFSGDFKKKLKGYLDENVDQKKYGRPIIAAVANENQTGRAKWEDLPNGDNLGPLISLIRQESREGKPFTYRDLRRVGKHFFGRQDMSISVPYEGPEAGMIEID
ncbi:hypothetical protein KY343_04215 [Candidatus Woesearchaeota archaeon]|nr:hypothetical protein [Candidatus Woesearchaeota archaeon]